MRIYRRRQLCDRLRRAGLVPFRGHHAHALHSPYWWLRCAIGMDREANPLVKAYHRLLVWDITASDAAHPLARGGAQPGARQEPRRLRPQAMSALARDRDRPDRRVDSLAPAAKRDGPLVPGRPRRPLEPRRGDDGPRRRRAAGPRSSGPSTGWRPTSCPTGAGARSTWPTASIEPRRDPNVCAYLGHRSVVVLRSCAATSARSWPLWPMLERAISWCLRYQRPGGEIVWSVGPDGVPGNFALLAATSSFQHSLRSAARVAEALGHEPSAEAGRRPTGWPRRSRDRPGPSHRNNAGPWTGTTRC